VTVIIDYTGKSYSYNKGLQNGLTGTLKDGEFLFIYPCEERGFLRFLNNNYFRKVLIPIYAILCYSWILTSPRVTTVHWQWFTFDRFKIELFILQLFQLVGKKVVVTVHNILPHDSGNRYIAFYKSIYIKANRILCHSHSSKNELVKNFSVRKEKIVVIPHGIFPQWPNETKKKSNAIKFLIFGQIRNYKGIKEFISGIWNNIFGEKVSDEFSMELKIVGKCSRKMKLELMELINTPIHSNIRFNKGYL